MTDNFTPDLPMPPKTANFQDWQVAPEEPTPEERIENLELRVQALERIVGRQNEIIRTNTQQMTELATYVTPVFSAAHPPSQPHYYRAIREGASAICSPSRLNQLTGERRADDAYILSAFAEQSEPSFLRRIFGL
jgi:hypothetical protein